jgi:hypothetical protein
MALKERDMGDSFRTIVDLLASLEFDPPWAFGNLGFKFWNWPPLKRSLIEQISGILGHGVIIIAGKI